MTVDSVHHEPTARGYCVTCYIGVSAWDLRIVQYTSPTPVLPSLLPAPVWWAVMARLGLIPANLRFHRLSLGSHCPCRQLSRGKSL